MHPDQYSIQHAQVVERVRRNCRRQKWILAAFLALAAAGMILAFVPGCSVLHQIAPGAVADTPAKRWAQAREALTSTSELFVTLEHAGVLDDRQVVQYGTLLREARALIGTEPPAGVIPDDTLEARLREAQDLLTQLKTTLQEASHERNRNSSRDSWRHRHGLDRHPGNVYWHRRIETAGGGAAPAGRVVG